MGKAKHYISVAILIVISTFILRGALKYFYRLPVAASAQAVPIDQMFNAHFWMISFLFSFIMVFMLYAATIFKRKEGDNEPGPHVHSNTGLEIAWTIIPIFFVIAFGYWGVVVLNALTAEQPDEMVVKVYGQQWLWQFEYPEQEGITSQELVLPIDQRIVLEMESRDVLHSFWIPEFRVKQDLLPGMVRELRITPTRLGDYRLLCAEICGQDHSKMQAAVHIVSRSEFDAWVEEKLSLPAYAEMTPAERGEIWYNELACSGCHNTTGAPGGAGPTWQGIYGREELLTDGTTIIVDHAYIYKSILEPNSQIVSGFNEGIMPQDYGTRIDKKQAEILANEGIEIDVIDDLISFMQTLEE